ncbi:DUF6492 family protein [Alsobacter sp. R-9]
MPGSAALLSFSFRGDFELCCLMCETVDRFVSPEIPHILLVPRSDRDLFAPLANGRRRIEHQEDLLPPWLFRLPMPPANWRARLGLPRRNVYVSLRGGLVRGWIVQQIMKIAAAARSREDAVVHVDSDVAFIRPLMPADLFKSDGVRFKQVPGAANDPSHHPWHLAASSLLGLPPSAYHGADYIDTVVTWRPAVARLMTSHIEGACGRDWISALARADHLSEYTLYGVFCEKVLGMTTAGHSPTSVSLCETLWDENLTESEAVATLERDLRPAYAAIGIQSTIKLNIDARRRIVDHSIAFAAAQDRDSSVRQTR